MKVKKAFWLVLGLGVLCIILATNPELNHSALYTRLSILWAIIITSSFFWATFSLQGIKIVRRSRTKKQQVGQLFTERIEIINSSKIFKFWIKVADNANLPDSDASKVLSYIGPGQSRSYSVNILLKYRGAYELGPTKITSGDVFGLFMKSRVVESQTRLTVLPYTVDIQNFPAPYGLLPGGRALRQKTTEVTPYSSGVREYTPGDPLRRIHWLTSAKKQRLIVKEFEKDPLATVWLFLDARFDHSSSINDEHLSGVDPDKFFWMGFRPKFELPKSSLEYAISATASVAKYYIKQRREVGLSISAETHVILSSERGERQLEKIMETLSMLQAGGVTSLYSLVGSQINSLGRGNTVVIITADASEEVKFTSLQVLQRGLLPVIILIDAESFGGEGSSRELEEDLIAQGIIVTRIKFRDDLTKSLENRQFLNIRTLVNYW